MHSVLLRGALGAWRPLAVATLASTLVGCGQVKVPGLVPGGASAQGATPGQLVEVELPRYAPIESSMPGLKAHNLANPKAQPPAFQEDIAVRRVCSPLSLEVTGEDLALLPAQRQRLLALFEAGLDNERQRQRWNFELDRAEAQDRYLNGPPGARREVRNDAAPRPRTAAEAQQRQAEAPPPPAGGVGVRQTFKPTPPVRYPTVPGQEARANAEREAQARANGQLAHNLNVLKAQDQTLAARERQLAQGLAEVLRDQVGHWQTLPAQQFSPQRLAAIDQLRSQQIDHCARARGRLSDATTALLFEQDDKFAAWAKRTVEGQLPVYLALLKPAKSSEALNEAMALAFPSPLMQKVAQQATEFNQQAQRRREDLLTAERQAREQAARLAAAESARVAQAERRALLDKVKRNAAPQAEDIARVLADRSERLSSEVPFSHVRRTSTTGYEMHRTVFGVTWKAAEYHFGVEAVACKPVNGGQLCSYLENALHRAFPIDMGGAAVQSTDTAKRSHIFRWTEAGLVADQGLKVAHLVWQPGGGGGSGGSSSSDRALEEESRNRSNYYVKKSGNEVRGPYDSNKRY